MGDNKKKLPKIFIVLRIAAFIGIGIAFILFVKGIFIRTLYHIMPYLYSNLWFSITAKRTELYYGGGAVIIFSLFLLLVSYIPKIQKIGIKTQRYIVNENQKDLKDLSNQVADITSDGITIVAKSIKKGSP